MQTNVDRQAPVSPLPPRQSAHSGRSQTDPSPDPYLRSEALVHTREYMGKWPDDKLVAAILRDLEAGEPVKKFNYISHGRNLYLHRRNYE